MEEIINKMAKNNLEGKTIRELIDLEIAARIVCSKYENENRINGYANLELNDKFQKCNNQYIKIFEQIEKYLDENV